MEIRTIDNIFDSNPTTSNGLAINIATVYSCIRILSSTIAATKIEYINSDEEKLPINPLHSKIKGTKFNFMTSILHDLFLHGNGFAWIKNNELIYLPNASVQIYITDNEEITHYYQISHFGKSFKIYEDEILHFKNMSNDGIIGLSPLQLHRQTFDSALSLQSYQENYVLNSTAISGIITTPKILELASVTILQGQITVVKFQS